MVGVLAAVGVSDDELNILIARDVGRIGISADLSLASESVVVVPQMSEIRRLFFDL